MGLTWQVLVIFGLHWGFIPVYINNIVTYGYDNVMMPFFACTFATSGVVLAILLRTHDRRLKEMCLPNFISGIFGVTEPAIYGILLLPLKKPMVISCIAGGIGGAFLGALNFRKFSMGGMGIFEFPAMVAPDGTLDNLFVAFAGVLIAMVIAFALTFALYRDKDEPGDGGAEGDGAPAAVPAVPGAAPRRRRSRALPPLLPRRSPSQARSRARSWSSPSSPTPRSPRGRSDAASQCARAPARSSHRSTAR